MTNRRLASRVGAPAAALLAVACCAGIPVIAAALGGITAAAVIGVVAGLITAFAIVVLALLFARSRRRRARVDGGR
jgi:hypothetical protein